MPYYPLCQFLFVAGKFVRKLHVNVVVVGVVLKQNTKLSPPDRSCVAALSRLTTRVAQLMLILLLLLLLLLLLPDIL